MARLDIVSVVSLLPHREQSACLHLEVVSNLHLGSGQRCSDHKEQPHNARR